MTNSPVEIATTQPLDVSSTDALLEMSAFHNANLWKGGFMDADPLEPLSWTSYTTTGFVSIYHALYLALVKPNIGPETVVLEVGPGRGAWTKAFLAAGAKVVNALDVQPREVNGIDRYLGSLMKRVNYCEVDDFSCDVVEDGSIDVIASLGTFVHLSRDAQQAYFQSFHKKMKLGAVGFVQYADLDRWNFAVTDASAQIDKTIIKHLGQEDAYTVAEILKRYPVLQAREEMGEHVRDWDKVSPGRYFFVGRDWIVNTLQGIGFEIIEDYTIATLRDPVVYFRKPD